MTSHTRPVRFSSIFVALLIGFAAIGINSTPAQAAVNTTEGREFWITFNENNGGVGDMRIYLSSATASEVTIYWPSGTTSTETLSPGTVRTVVANAVGLDDRAQSSVNTATEGTAANGIRLVATQPISVYGAHIKSGTSDAFTAIPTSSLGTKYRALSAPQNSNSWNHNRISVIATQSGTTTLTITPTQNLAGSNTAGVAYDVSLDQGEVYTVQTASSGGTSDLSGTLIESDKAVVVTSGDDCANFVAGACDHLVQYLPPTTAWGKSFVLPGSINSTRTDFYRVVADQDDTDISVDGSVQTTLDAGEVWTYTPSGSSAAQSQLLESSKPILVGHFLQAGDFSGETGDPAFSLVTPTLQFLSAYNFSTPETGFAVNLLTVVAKTADLGEISAPGITLASFSAVSGTPYSVSRTTISAGSYSISSSSGIGIYVSGFNSFNSYSYPGGYAVVDLIANPGGVEELSVTPIASESTPEGSTPGIFLHLYGQPGSRVEGSRVSYGAVSIKQSSPYTLSIQSATNPVATRTVLATGTVNEYGHLDERLELLSLAEGGYKVVMTGVHRSGDTLVLTNHILVNANGEFVSVSPEALQPKLN